MSDRAWIEKRAKELFNEIDYMGMAWEVDAPPILGKILSLLHSKSMYELDEYVATETLKYCFQLADKEWQAMQRASLEDIMYKDKPVEVKDVS